MKYSTFTSRYPFARGVEVLDLTDTYPFGRWVRSMATVSDVAGRRGERESSMSDDWVREMAYFSRWSSPRGSFLWTQCRVRYNISVAMLFAARNSLSFSLCPKGVKNSYVQSGGA